MFCFHPRVTESVPESILETLPTDLLARMSLYLESSTIYMHLARLSRRWARIITPRAVKGKEEEEGEGKQLLFTSFLKVTSLEFLQELASIYRFHHVTKLFCYGQTYQSQLQLTPKTATLLHFFHSLHSLQLFQVNFDPRTKHCLRTLPSSLQELKIISSSGVQFLCFQNACRNLEMLSLKGNDLTEYPNMLPESLIKLDISFNEFEHISVLPPYLQTLICSNNKLLTLPPIPCTLQTLYCDHNRLTAIQHLPPILKRLDYSFNKRLPPNDVCLLPASLIELDCSGLRLLNLPKCEIAYESMFLEELYCRDNLLKRIDSFPISLQICDISENEIKFLPELPPKLSRFICAHNPIESIPSLPESLKFLNTIETRLEHQGKFHSKDIFSLFQSKQS